MFIVVAARQKVRRLPTAVCGKHIAIGRGRPAVADDAIVARHLAAAEITTTVDFAHGYDIGRERDGLGERIGLVQADTLYDQIRRTQPKETKCPDEVVDVDLCWRAYAGKILVRRRRRFYLGRATTERAAGR